ncbi:unnamed protein product [Sphenostylis stenocarpa]|uniref:LOB domain-containing protein n=1 Tax=Sphenostylis stenocarpa TaxID=92480 RepID=A0AA86SE40_9FABA|nr:unnamed protein product [Sphenostylis stenocarpa]
MAQILTQPASSSFKLSNSTLRVNEQVIMSQVPDNITIIPCTYSPTTGSFIVVKTTSPNSHHVATLGKLQPATFVSIYRFQKWRNAVWTGSNGSHVQTETHFLLLQSNPSRLYVLFLPIVTLQPGPDDKVSVCLESESSHVTTSSCESVVYLHAGENPYTVVEEAARVLRDHLGTFKLLEEKTDKHRIYDYKYHVRKGVAGLVEGGCPPGFVLLENGVQCMRPIEVLVRALKEEFSTVECVFAWHALSEYWKRDGGMSEIEKLHSQLEAHGIDGVKVHLLPVSSLLLLVYRVHLQHVCSGCEVKIMASSSYSNSPCAACKFLRRKCMPDCIFAPYFPPEEPQKFANVHKIFGASNVSKLLNEVQPYQREDAVNSLAYEAEARIKDPVYGCVGAISVLQRQVLRLQKELDATNADLIRYSTCNEMPNSSTSHHGGRSKMSSDDDGGGGSSHGLSFYYASANWNNDPYPRGDI